MAKGKKRTATAGAPAAKKAKTPAKTDAELAKLAVVRADRLTLETALVQLVESGQLELSQLEACGLTQAPAPKACVTTTAALTSTGGMGAWERLDVEMLLSVVTYSGAAEVFAVSEVCKGLCSLRREPRCWRSLDTGTLKGMTSAGLRRLSKSVPTTQVERLTLRASSYKDAFTSQDWVAFLKGLDCRESLRHLALNSKKFGAGAQTLRAVEPLVDKLESLRIEGVKQNNMDALMKLLRAAPRLTDLDVEASETPWRFFLDRLAQLPAIQRGPGAKSLLKRIANNGFVYGMPTHTKFLLGVSSLFPELRELQLKGLYANLDSAPPSPLSMVRVLRLREINFLPGNSIVYSTFLSGEQAAPMCDAALSAYVHDVERAVPLLETWETTREREYISSKEQAQGMRFQPAPVLRNCAGLRFPHLTDLIFEDIGFEPASFAGVETPKLKEVSLFLSNLTHASQRTRYADNPIGAIPMQENATVREAVTRPLVDSAEADVDVKWLKAKKPRS